MKDKNTEFKRDYVEDIKKTLIAFANTDGGNLYIGIDDDGNAVEKEEIKSRPEIQKVFGFSQTTVIVTIAALID